MQLTRTTNGRPYDRRQAFNNLWCFAAFQHHFDAVDLVDLAGSGVVIKGDDADAGVALFDGFEHAATGDMVGQTGKGLHTDDAVCAAVNKIKNLGCEEPALPCVIAQREKALDFFCQLINCGRRGEAT